MYRMHMSSAAITSAAWVPVRDRIVRAQPCFTYPGERGATSQLKRSTYNLSWITKTTSSHSHLQYQAEEEPQISLMSPWPLVRVPWTQTKY